MKEKLIETCKSRIVGRNLDAEYLRKNISENIRFLRDYYNLQDQELGEILGKGKSTISSYLTNRIKPSLEILNKISIAFGVSVNTLLNCDLREIFNNENKIGTGEPSDVTWSSTMFSDPEYKKFINNKYYIYYFNTHPTEENQNIINRIDVQFLQNFDKRIYEASAFIGSSNKKYIGTLVLTRSFHAYIYLRGVEHYERVLITFQFPDNGPLKPYIGGLGLISSIACGAGKEPCSQKILISHKEIELNSYEDNIKSFLLLTEEQNRNGLMKVTNIEDKSVYAFLKAI